MIAAPLSLKYVCSTAERSGVDAVTLSPLALAGGAALTTSASSYTDLAIMLLA